MSFYYVSVCLALRLRVRLRVSHNAKRLVQLFLSFVLVVTIKNCDQNAVQQKHKNYALHKQQQLNLSFFHHRPQTYKRKKKAVGGKSNFPTSTIPLKFLVVQSVGLSLINSMLTKLDWMIHFLDGFLFFSNDLLIDSH